MENWHSNFPFRPIWIQMMIIAPTSRAHKGGKERREVKGEYGGVWGEEEGNADYAGMVQPSQQHVAPCIKVVDWGFGTRGIKQFHELLTWPGYQNYQVTKADQIENPLLITSEHSTSKICIIKMNLKENNCVLKNVLRGQF